MTVLDIVQYPDPRLRMRATPVAEITPEITQLMTDMVDTMEDSRGIGLAAPQVGVLKRVIVIGKNVTGSQSICMINPEITQASKDQVVWDEACLSVPGYTGPVTRPAKVTVKGLNPQGEAFELNLSYILAACVQHEIDHLDGKVFLDHLSSLRRDMIKKKIQKRLLGQ